MKGDYNGEKMDSFSHRYIILLSQPVYLRPARKSAVESMFLSTLLLPKSSTRREDLLLNPDELEAINVIRKAFNGMKADEAVERVVAWWNLSQRYCHSYMLPLPDNTGDGFLLSSLYHTPF